MCCVNVYAYIDLRRSLFSRGGSKLEQTVIFLRNAMIFLKVPVGMRKTASLTMEKKPLGVVQSEIKYHSPKSKLNMFTHRMALRRFFRVFILSRIL